MTATFCNVPSGPNTNGYGSPGGAGSGGGTGPSANPFRRWDQDLVSSLISCLVIRLPKNLSVMGRLFGVGVFCEGPAMDTRRSYYLHSKQDFNDIPFVMPANDNMRAKDRLSARCGSLLLSFNCAASPPLVGLDL
jgi:hypothetical protein